MDDDDVAVEGVQADDEFVHGGVAVRRHLRIFYAAERRDEDAASHASTKSSALTKIAGTARGDEFEPGYAGELNRASP